MFWLHNCFDGMAAISMHEEKPGKVIAVMVWWTLLQCAEADRE